MRRNIVLMPLNQIAATLGRAPPFTFFMVSAVFHYLGPSFAVLLFAHIEPLGVAWLRIASATLVLTAWRRPWRHFGALSLVDRWCVVGLGVVMAGMNSLFYLAIALLPLSTVSAIEFLGPIALAAMATRTLRNSAALLIAVAGVWILTDVRIEGELYGFMLAFANCVLFVVYIVLGHRISGPGSIDRLAMALVIAMVCAMPFGLGQATPAFTSATLLAAAVAVGVTSSVIPYIADQLAMARIPRATFAMMLSLLPATATAIGFLVLGQVPGPAELAGIALVVAGVALHRARYE